MKCKPIYIQTLLESIEDQMDAEAIAASDGEGLIDFDLAVKEIEEG